jgi:hypothetical protein
MRSSKTFSRTMLRRALWTANSTDEYKQLQIEANFDAMAVSRDEAEGMLVAQMVPLHSTAMDCLRRAAYSGLTFEGRQQNLNFANKLARTYALQMEALDKHRGKGQQKVTVEHVHVSSGRPGIVGAVETGVGVTSISEEQCLAGTIAHAPEQEMQGAFETKWEAMPPVIERLIKWGLGRTWRDVRTLSAAMP